MDSVESVLLFVWICGFGYTAGLAKLDEGVEEAGIPAVIAAAVMLFVTWPFFLGFAHSKGGRNG